MSAAILPATSDYTAKEFDSLRTRLESLIRSVFRDWTDFQVANFGTLLMEMTCFVGDVLAFYQDNQAAESRIATATQRRNLLALVKLINYTPALAVAATAEETITATGLAANCTIPAGQIFKTEGDAPVEFQLLAPVHLTPSAPSATGTLEHSKSHTETYAGTGRANQSVELSEAGFLEVVSVTGSTSGEWYPALENTFLSKNASDKLFTVSVDNNDKATLQFSDGVSGAMPGDTLTIVYKTGGGAEGNVAANSIVKIDGTILDVSSNVVDLAATNARAATGGADRETAESIRVRAPLSIRNPVTSVAREDFEDHATTAVSGITRALMLNNDLDGTIERNSGVLYLVPSGTAPNIGFPTYPKLDEVRRLFVGDTQARPPFPAPMTFELEVLPAVYLDIAITVKVWLKRGADATATKAAIIGALISYFNPVLAADGTPNPRINFGYYLRILSGDDSITHGEIPLSDLIDVVRDVDGVFKVGTAEADFLINGWTVSIDPVSGVESTTPVISGAHADVELDDKWFPRLRVAGGLPDVTIVDGATNSPL